MKVFTLSVALACALAYASATSVTCGTDDTLLPNPDDCTSYYICDNGVPIESPCPPGLHFNAVTLGCDFPENSNCQVGPSTAAPTTSKPTTTTTTPKPTTTTPKPTTTTTTPKPTTTTTTTTPKPTTTTTTTTTPKPTTTTTTTPKPTTTTTTTTPKPTTTTTTTTTPKPTTTTTTTTPKPTTTPLPTTTTTTTRRPTTTTEAPTRPTSTTTQRPTNPPSTSTTPAPTTTSPPSNVTSTTPKDPTITTPSLPPLNSTTPNDPTVTTPSTPSNNTTSEPGTTAIPDSSLCPANGSAVIPNTADCSSFIVCVNGAPSDPVSCPSGLLFSDVLGACDNEEDVDCSYTTTTTTTTTTAATTTLEPEDPSTDAPGFEPDCPEEGFSIIENPGSCNSFYVCINGANGLIRCPAGLDFNPATLSCDLPEDPNCGHTNPPPPFEPECPANVTVQVPNPYDCSSFYICINGNYAKLSCPDNYAFNETKQACVASSESTCVALEIVQNALYTCEEDGSFPDPTDCGSYFVCDGNQIFPMECPPGLYFDPKTGNCNVPSAVDCDANSPSTTPSPSPSTSTSRPTSPPPTSSPTAPTTKPTTSAPTTTRPSTSKPNGPDCPAQGSAILPDPEDCTQFYVCIEGNSDIIECPEGYGFSEEQLTCVKAEEVGCNVPTGPQCPADGTAKLPNPEDCSSYYFCINGVSALLKCPEGMNFDEKNSVCSETATCKSGSTSSPVPPSSSSTSRPTSTSSTSKPTSTTTTGKPTSTTGKPTTPPAGSDTCDFDEEGQLRPNPNSCTSFLQCAGGNLVQIDCPPGLEFNSVSLVCDLPSLANCSTKKSLLYFLGL